MTRKEFSDLVGDLDKIISLQDDIENLQADLEDARDRVLAMLENNGFDTDELPDETDENFTNDVVELIQVGASARLSG